MNNESAKKGFRTFILTLSVSLIVFSVIYYVITNTSFRKEQETLSLEKPAAEAAQVPAKQDSTFQQLASTKVDVPAKAVLAGSTVAQTTQSTTSVPSTGTSSITMGLVLSLFIFFMGIIYNSMNPRKVALTDFEKNILKKL
jgi:hypothetical protein